MNLDEYRMLFRVVTLALLLIASFAFFSSVLPIPQTGEKFFVSALLGSEKMSENYFPNDNSTVSLNDEVSWHLVVYNYMPTVQYVSVIVKLINSTISSPDAVECVPSPAAYEIMNFSVFLTYEKSAWIPFVWMISSTTMNDGVLKINSLRVNDIFVSSNISAVNGSDFKFVFELWWFNVTLNQFEFAWESGFGLRCAWSQMLFDVAGN